MRRESRSSTISSSRKHHRRVLFNEEEILKVLNEYRNQHGSGPLQWSTSCAKRAQGRSDHSAGGQTTEYGENLARSTNARWEDANIACIAAIHHWQVRFSLPLSLPTVCLMWSSTSKYPAGRFTATVVTCKRNYPRLSVEELVVLMGENGPHVYYYTLR